MNSNITLEEMKSRAIKYRALESIHKAFTKCTNCTWDEANERYPWHTDDNRLRQFLGLNFVNNVPDHFVLTANRPYVENNFRQMTDFYLKD